MSSKLSYCNVFPRTSFSNRNEKKKQGAYLGLSILELSKILTCEFWFDYVKPRYGDDCIIWIKTVSLYT